MQTPDTEISLHVSVRSQTLEVRGEAQSPPLSFDVSTSRFGLGTTPGSYRTPLGEFKICEKIGEGAKIGAVFRSRILTGELGLDNCVDDLVLTRILWLAGAEPENANTQARYIYIHGTNHENLLGTAASHGCVRMANRDIVELFDRVEVGTTVRITLD